MNHENITSAYLHANGQTVSGSGASAVRTVADEVVKEINAHGVSVVEVQRGAAGWSYHKASGFNRRITAASEIALSGPAARTPYMVTRYATDGGRTRGTVNNCANGRTPWGTYLTCEENWNGYFRRIAATDNPNRSTSEIVALARYGVAGNGNNFWATVTPDTGDHQFGRWNAMKTGTSTDGSDDYRNAPNTFGWVVEIDPFVPSSTPKKRTAMGRFAHENVVFGRVVAGQPLVAYMGDDSRGEYIYKYVSTALWDPADATSGMAAGDKYLDDGKLYVARFNDDGSGQWIELRLGVNGVTSVTNTNGTYTFASQADVLVHARLAADGAGATRMDRPEWVAVNPANGEVYVTLTNNSQRTVTAGAQRVNAANPRVYANVKPGAADRGNVNGHIISWSETDPSATSFMWDVYLFGARANADASNVNLSVLTDANDFSSPDGLFFSESTRLLWIQTDDGAYTDVTNCMLLAALPGTRGDGDTRTVTASDGSNSTPVNTFVGTAPGDARLRRFLVGPKECEITGLAETPDGTALFVNIQHPGEDTPPNFSNPSSFGSHWPDGGNARPRSATVVITKNDGGRIGS